ncbi:hypothetical protein C3L33_15916, partial [Rhododendron williamsianum]
MNLPSDYRFRPTDKELLDYLKKKSKDEALPCDVVIEREIYGIGDKAPWQIFTDEDPWQICRTRDRKENKLKTQGTIYVLTTLIKTSEKEIIRTAGCGSWNGGTALEQVVDMDKDDISVIGYKRMLRFQITNESECKTDLRPSLPPSLTHATPIDNPPPCNQIVFHKKSKNRMQQVTGPPPSRYLPMGSHSPYFPTESPKRLHMKSATTYSAKALFHGSWIGLLRSTCLQNLECKVFHSTNSGIVPISEPRPGL